jgi:hypothetical protein
LVTFSSTPPGEQNTDAGATPARNNAKAILIADLLERRFGISRRELFVTSTGAKLEYENPFEKITAKLFAFVR